MQNPEDLSPVPGPGPVAGDMPEGELHYRTIFNNRTYAIAHCRVVTDAAGRPTDYAFERVNAAFEQVLGIARGEVEGRLLSEAFPAARQHAFDYVATFGGIGLAGSEGMFDVFDPQRERWFHVYAYSHRRGHFTLIFFDASARKRTEQALQESEERSRATFEQAAVGMAHMDLQGHFLRINRKYAEMLGYGSEELLARSFLDVTHPEDRHIGLAEARQLLAGEIDTFAAEKRYLHRAGHSVWARVTVSAVRDGSGRLKYKFVVAEDITERKQSQIMLEGVFHHAAMGMAVLDTEGHVLRANERLATILGYPVEELRGDLFRAVTFPEDRQGNKELFGQLLAGHIPEYTVEKRYRRKDGTPVWCLVSVALVQDEGRATPYVVILVKDIEARKRLEVELNLAKEELEARVLQRTHELQLATQQAEEALRAAEAASQAKTEFLAIMSHEIRTPLNGVIGFNGLLLDGPLNEEKRRYAELARQSGESLLHLLNDFLDFSKIEAGHLELEPIDFDLNEELRLVQSLVQEEAHHKNLELHSLVDAPSHLRGDAARLRQVLLNLLSNAVKFTARGEVRLSCEETAREGDTTWLCLQVNDTGIGIDPSVRERLFQPFVQADASTTRRFGGTGLGLAICKRLVEAMGGRMGLSSVPGEGSSFWVELPFRLRRRHEPFAHPAPTAGTIESCRGRVLVVEDNPVSQLLAATMLKRMGCRVDTAGNGQEAVDACRHLPYDLVLMDCDMPVLDGFDATRAIRAAEAPGRHVPIIAVTASALAGDSERCREAGMDDFIAKPVRQQELGQKVRAWLKPAED